MIYIMLQEKKAIAIVAGWYMEGFKMAQGKRLLSDFTDYAHGICVYFQLADYFFHYYVCAFYL